MITYTCIKQLFRNKNHCWPPNYGNQFSNKYACKYIKLIYVTRIKWCIGPWFRKLLDTRFHNGDNYACKYQIT